MRFLKRRFRSHAAAVRRRRSKAECRRLHVQYMTQASVRPPTFVVFTSGGKAGLHFSYLRYLQNRLREEFDFFATPLRIVEKHKKQRKRRR